MWWLKWKIPKNDAHTIYDDDDDDGSTIRVQRGRALVAMTMTAKTNDAYTHTHTIDISKSHTHTYKRTNHAHISTFNNFIHPRIRPPKSTTKQYQLEYENRLKSTYKYVYAGGWVVFL